MGLFPTLQVPSGGETRAAMIRQGEIRPPSADWVCPKLRKVTPQFIQHVFSYLLRKQPCEKMLFQVFHCGKQERSQRVFLSFLLFYAHRLSQKKSVPFLNKKTWEIST